MKILFLLTQDLESPDGAGRIFPLGRELARLGHQVSIAALHSNFRSLEKTHFWREGVEVIYCAQMHVHKMGNTKRYFSPLRLLQVSVQATWALIHIALQTRADIVHVNKPHPMNSLAGLAAKTLHRCPLVLDCSDYEAGTNFFTRAWQKRIVAWFEDQMPRHADALTAHAAFIRERLLSLGIEPGKIAYLPNGVDRERFGPVDDKELSGLRAALGLENKRVVAFIGTLTAHAHAVDLLVEAFQQVLKEIPESALMIVGGGENFERLQEKVHQCGIGTATVFCGRVPAAQVNQYYHLAEVSVDPVRDTDAVRARFPLKLFESWATGVPFVTSDVGDRHRLLEDPPAGLLVAPGDAGALAGGILRILKDPILAGELKRNGMERAGAFDWKILALDMEKVYRNLLA